MKSTQKTFRNLALLLPLAGTLAGCTRDHKFQPVDMWNASRLKPYEEINIPGGTTALSLPDGAVARGQLRSNDGLNTGKDGGKLLTAYPFRITDAVLQRGQERYGVFCAPCHGGLGDGKGIIVERGFAMPPDYMQPRLLNAPVGHFYDVITNGYGAMYSYAARVPVEDRWAITAYIRLLQQTRKRAGQQENKPGGAKVKIPTITGGGVYSPNLKPRPVEGSGHGAGGHGSEHNEGAATHNAPGVAPHSQTTESDQAPGGAAEGATHEKAIGSQSMDKASNAQGPSPESGR